LRLGYWIKVKYLQCSEVYIAFIAFASSDPLLVGVKKIIKKLKDEETLVRAGVLKGGYWEAP